MTIVKTTLIALSVAAAGSASAFACSGQINASLKGPMPAVSTSQARIEPSTEEATVARAASVASEPVVVTE